MKYFVFSLGLSIFSLMAFSQDDKEKEVQIVVQGITDNIFMLQGQGGNIAVVKDEGGLWMIDDQFAPLTEKIVRACKSISDSEIKFVLNTHWHGDHTGGNENMRGEGAVIIAHENVRKRMNSEQFMSLWDAKVPASSKAALPEITFTEDIQFYSHDEQVSVIHMPNAHTDGDAIVHFPESNVIHMGDLYFQGTYPFIDIDAGGSIDGIIAGVEKTIALCDKETVLIPGHGRLSNRSELQDYLDMLTGVRDKIYKGIKYKVSLEQMIKTDYLESFTEEWGGGFIDSKTMILMVHSGLTEKPSDQ